MRNASFKIYFPLGKYKLSPSLQELNAFFMQFFLFFAQLFECVHGFVRLYSIILPVKNQ